MIIRVRQIPSPLFFSLTESSHPNELRFAVVAIADASGDDSVSQRESRYFSGLTVAVGLALTLMLAGCGGGSSPAAGGTTPAGSAGSCNTTTGGSGNTGGNSTYRAINGANTQPITVFDSSFEYSYINQPMVSVVVCVPGTTTCQTIPDVLLDTGSFGLRLFASAVNISLPPIAGNPEEDQGGEVEAECAEFVATYVWGPVVRADVKLGDQSAAHTAPSVPVQLIGSNAYPNVPTSCTDTGLIATDSVPDFGANGVLGVGVMAQDNGSYYECTAQDCAPTYEPGSLQVTNPIALLPTDNNGVIVSLPPVGSSGAATETGTLVLGIGTQSNNATGSAQIFTTTPYGNFTVRYDGASYSGFLDTGSDALYVLGASSLSISTCSAGTVAGYYCPSTTQNYSVEPTGTNTISTSIGFSIANASSLVATGNGVFSDFAAPYFSTVGDVTMPAGFDLGLPFFLGRNVFVGLQLVNNGVGVASSYGYWAF